MKKMYTLSVIIMMTCGILIGQTALNNAPIPKKKTVSNKAVQSQSQSINRSHSQKHLASIIWSDDFSNPSNWVMTNEVSNNDNWIITNHVPASTYAIQEINSTTHSNGFAIFDSDSLSAANSTLNQIGDLTNATAINCSGHPLVQLSFQEQYERFYDSTFVLVSNDNVNWTSYSVNTYLDPTDFCPSNPDTVVLNISPTAGNHSTVWIRFQFYSPSSVFGNAAGDGYSWMIDDVSITDIDSNDIQIQGISFEYSQIPVGEQYPLFMSAAVSNVGGVSQSNVILGVNVNSGVFTGTTATYPAMAPAETDTFYITNNYTPGAVGNYNFVFTATQSQTDATPGNNVASATLMVTDTTFARDDNYITGLLGSLDNGYSTQYDPFEAGNIFYITNPTMATSVTFVVNPDSNLTQAGAELDVKLYSVDTTNPVYYRFIQVGTTSFPYYLQQSDIPTSIGPNPTSVTIPFSSTIAMTHGYYLATVEFLGGSQGASIEATQSTMVPVFSSWFYDAIPTDTTWYYNDRYAMVRLNMNPSAGIPEIASSNGIKLFQNEPNPYSSSSIISYEIPTDASVILNITDMIGTNVMTIEEGSQTAGLHQVTIGNSLSKGIYFYTLKVGETTLTKKMVVTE